MLAAAGSALLVALLPAPGAVAAKTGRLQGQVLSGKGPLRSSPVILYGVSPGKRNRPFVLARSRTRSDGTFKMRHRKRGRKTILYLLVGKGKSTRLASVLGNSPGPSQVVVNERTTVASGFALAQFIRGGTISGPSPGLQNAAGMVRNLVNVRTGGLSGVLTQDPNGTSTSTLREFNSLANMLPRCVRNRSHCGGLFRAAKPPGGRAPKGTLEAVADIARSPWKKVARLFKLALTQPAPYRPALDPSQTPDAWTLALRFNGDGHTMDGPGNIAIDGHGNLWVNNNYTYSADRFASQCSSDLLFKFNPRGRYVQGSPYAGGGLSGAGFGITLDPRGRVWVGNFGFSSPGCPVIPPRNSVSLFDSRGRALSPAQGFTQGGIASPQATVSDRKGTIWVANCADGSITRIPGGNPAAAQKISGLGLVLPFGVGINRKGQSFVTGLGSSNVAILNKDGTPTPNSPIGGGFLKRPMGIAPDSRGNMWVANSGIVDLPCPFTGPVPEPPLDGSVALLGPDGTPKAQFRGAGMTIPWGIAVDGNDNVWVANFQGQRISEICGLRRRHCRPGSAVGSPISPESGYGFDGLTRLTGAAIDPSGNVWFTNNWKLLPPPANPGGYEIVAFIGLGGPLKTPTIGTPRSP
jgi:sugar lactone lactonase YvrE